MRYFSGQGKVYLAPRGSSGSGSQFAFLGNCAQMLLRLGRAGDRFSLGGAAAVAALAKPGMTPEIEMLLDEFDRDELERVMYGQASVVSGATATNEAVVASLGRLVPLENMNVTAFTSLRNAALTVTYVNGTDYTVNLKTGSLEFPAAGSAIVEGQQLAATYTYGTHEKVSAFTVTPAFYALRFEGFNTAMEGSPGVVLDAYMVKLMPVESMPILGDGFADMRLLAKVHYDDGRPANTTDGRYLRIRQV